MTSDPANRDLVARWQEGDQWAAQVLVDRYLARLTSLARARLSRKLARRMDAEDVVLSAWRSFFVATGRGRITVPDDDNLWPILVTLTLRKLSHQAARHQCERRDVNRDQPMTSAFGWPMAIAADPSPEDAAALLDELEYLLAQLSSQDREILSRRLRGDRPQEIATDVGCSERTVRRAIRRARNLAEARQAEPPDAVSDRLPSPLKALRVRAEEPQREFMSGTSFDGMPPTISFGDIQLQEMVGQGGFGKVYRALDRRCDRLVAVKYLRKSFWADRRAVDSLLLEIVLVSKLSHTSIIRHHGWGHTAAGAIFVVMDWIDGPNLSDVIRRGVIPIEDARCYGLTIAEAVESAHEAGVTHGDLTPSNVLLGSDGRVVLTDFGFARWQARPAHGPPGGTPEYLAPEQVSDVFGEVNQRTDVYGLGALLYALLTGEPPMQGADVPEILANVLSTRPASAPSLLRDEIPPKLEQLVLDCLQKEPADRPASIRVVRSQLAKLESTGNSGTNE